MVDEHDEIIPTGTNADKIKFGRHPSSHRTLAATYITKVYDDI